MILLPFLIFAKADWPSFRVSEVQMAFQMPSKPTYKKALFHNTPTSFYSLDTEDGRFVVGYIPFPQQIQETMHKKIVADPSADGIRSLISMNVGTFAKGGDAKVVSPQFGLSQGLPAEFAVLDNGKAQLQIRVYLGSMATYIFVTSSSSDAGKKFFDSIKLPPDVEKS